MRIEGKKWKGKGGSKDTSYKAVTLKEVGDGGGRIRLVTVGVVLQIGASEAPVVICSVSGGPLTIV